MQKPESHRDRRRVAHIPATNSQPLQVLNTILDMLSEPLPDDGVRVVVTPSQASYFAGEPFSVAVTITNTKGPQSGQQMHPPSNPQLPAHKRGAHSVSYIPMARPPTSPGTRNTSPAIPRPQPAGGVIVRRGIIGKARPARGIDDAGEQPEETRKRLLLNRSQSISVTVNDLRTEAQDDARGKSPLRTLRSLETPMSCTHPVLSYMFAC